MDEEDSVEQVRNLWDGDSFEESAKLEVVDRGEGVEVLFEGGTLQEKPASLDTIRSREDDKLSESSRLLKSVASLVSVCLEAEGKDPWWFLSVYGPVIYGNRDSFWDELAGLSAICGDKWCVGGDFNVVRRVEEKLNSIYNTRSMKMFDALIRELNLVDPKLQNGWYTWSNYRQKPICCRLDKFFHTPSWSEFYPFIRQEVLVRAVSDHSPVVLDSCPPSRGPSPFKFDNTWLEHKDFSRNLQDWWASAKVQGWSGFKFMSKLAFVRDYIKKWSRQVFGERKMRKLLLERRLFEMDRLEEGGSWNEHLLLEHSKVKEDWQQIVFEEEISVWFKVNCQWAKEGDANSKLFHSILSARKARNFISRIEEEDGNVWDKDPDIEKAIVGFYSSLYSAVSREWIGVDGISWSPIPSVMASFLERPFSEDEIRQAVFACDGSKAPGPDGFSMAVYQKNWDVMKNDLLDVFHGFFKDGVIHGRTNETFIWLIPKKLNSCRVRDYKPISLRKFWAEWLIRLKSAFRGFSVGKDRVDVSHLQFADDTIFFANDEESLLLLLDILKVFGVVFGLSINLQKCQLLGINMQTELVDRKASEIGCESAFLSRGGRLTLIQSVLSSLLVYYLSLFRIPKNVVEVIEKLMCDFLWEGADKSGADHLVSWNEVCNSRSHGGLRIGNLVLRNKAFLMKWLWRFPLETLSLWHRVVKSRYGDNGGRWDTYCGDRLFARGPWRDITFLYEDYRHLVYFKVGRGDRICFWEDTWFGDCSLKSKFNDLFRVSEAANFLIKDMVVAEDRSRSGGLGWDFRFRRNLFDREVPTLIEMLVLLKVVDLPAILEDKRIWKPDSSDVFSCKMTFHSLAYAHLGPEFSWAKRLWKSGVPSKVKVFGWLLFLDKLSVHVKGRKKDGAFMVEYRPGNFLGYLVGEE
ncbi:uncharacterized protein LOC133831865 [Humulus lupulus]|uniref:uncharacterized protein LOC133831865 n=1 Tax=Humulus lupulus TaxID=3486 RepID=UPI002B407396|nr:uncharacterized protein LOC133831865 [Humulus lupulus]